MNIAKRRELTNWSHFVNIQSSISRHKTQQAKSHKTASIWDDLCSKIIICGQFLIVWFKREAIKERNKQTGKSRILTWFTGPMQNARAFAGKKLQAFKWN